MTLAEAIRALSEGKRIRRIPWEWEIYSQYIQLNKDGQLVNEKGDPVLLFFDSADFKTDNWEIVHEPVLKDDEKLFSKTSCGRSESGLSVLQS